MTAIDERLLVQATPELLTGWCGPAALLGEDDPVSVVAFRPDTNYAAISYMAIGCLTAHWQHISALSLDLSRAECRDRVDRIRWGSPAEVQVMRAYRAGKPMGVVVRVIFGDRTLVYCEGGSWLDGGQGHDPTRFVPTFADLDPDDITLLPDGSRLVDALARAVIWREVRGEK